MSVTQLHCPNCSRQFRATNPHVLGQRLLCGDCGRSLLMRSPTVLEGAEDDFEIELEDVEPDRKQDAEPAVTPRRSRAGLVPGVLLLTLLLGMAAMLPWTFCLTDQPPPAARHAQVQVAAKEQRRAEPPPINPAPPTPAQEDDGAPVPPSAIPCLPKLLRHPLPLLSNRRLDPLLSLRSLPSLPPRPRTQRNGRRGCRLRRKSKSTRPSSAA